MRAPYAIWQPALLIEIWAITSQIAFAACLGLITRCESQCVLVWTWFRNYRRTLSTRWLLVDPCRCWSCWFRGGIGGRWRT
ncbi:hypothetical protein, partial [Allofranklinella schreckenbergeri]|uniref:hypothetical protein n=1 Tax=Allofranklinella schreckenbergeri TaxID=1076744 RepID=UPI001EEEF2BD